jgi:hypothetical protein
MTVRVQLTGQPGSATITFYSEAAHLSHGMLSYRNPDDPQEWIHRPRHSFHEVRLKEAVPSFTAQEGRTVIHQQESPNA